MESNNEYTTAGVQGPSTRSLRWLAVWLLLSLVALFTQQSIAADNTLESVSYSALPGDQVQLVLQFTQAPPEPLAFTVDNPARIALDFPGTRNQARRSQDIGIGVARSVHTAEAQGRTRVVLNLAQTVSYQTEIDGNELVLTLGKTGASQRFAAAPSTGGTQGASSASRVTRVDFRRGETGEARVLVNLSDPNVPFDLREQGGRIVLDFLNTRLPEELERRLDVVDFATPVKTVDVTDAGDDVRLTIDPIGSDYEYLAYQSDNLFTIEVRQVPEEVQEARRKEEYTGERLSLNFQDIEVRSVLQLLADFTGLNLVVSDTVSGNLTLRLKNVPWDQALDIILKTKGLAMRQTGNVVLIAPSEEIAAREKLELEAEQQVRELAPLRSEFIQINYGKAGDIAALLSAPENSLLSERGNVAVDQRTNTLLVQDTAARLDDVRRLVEQLDIPVRQVLIESRIVIASDDFSRELGARFGISNADSGDDTLDFTAGSLEGTTQLINGDDLELVDRLNVNLPAASPAGSVGLALAKLPFGTLLELELSAAQAENRAEIVSTPRVVTSNQATARISQGVEIPYQEATSSGATNISFKEAVLSLEVTPQITPDGRIFMELTVNNDSVGQIFAGVPSINTREVLTQVLVDNGQTVVLGGIYEQASNNSVIKVPFFGDLPLLGPLFRNTLNSDSKTELLVFITPKIISEDLTLSP